VPRVAAATQFYDAAGNAYNLPVMPNPTLNQVLQEAAANYLNQQQQGNQAQAGQYGQQLDQNLDHLNFQGGNY